jgi:hypothetical protein
MRATRCRARRFAEPASPQRAVLRRGRRSATSAQSYRRRSPCARRPRVRRSCWFVAAATSESISASSSSGRISQPVLPSATIAAGPCARQAITGRPQAIASTRTSPNASATEGRTSASARSAPAAAARAGTNRRALRRRLAAGIKNLKSPATTIDAITARPEDPPESCREGRQRSGRDRRGRDDPPRDLARLLRPRLQHL